MGTVLPMRRNLAPGEGNLRIINNDMLTRVYIDNFRSFLNFEYFPERKQLLLGPNGSGKTSLLEAIRNVKSLVKGDSNRFTQSTRTRWLDRAAQVVELEAELDGKRFA